MIKYLSRLTSLDLSGNPLHSIPSEIKRLINLEKLILANCELNKISFTDLSYLKKLKKLDISGNKIETIPDQIGRLVGLTELSLSATGINALSDSISRLKQLKILNISKNRLNNTSFDKLYENKGLTNLDVSNNKIDIVPEGIGIFQQLSKLDLSENSILSLPDSLCLLEKLTDLKVKSSRVSISDIILPAKILNLKNLNEIDFVHELMLTAKKSEIEKENKKLLADFLTIGLIFMVVVAIFIYIFYRRYRHQKDMYKENYETLKKTKDMLIESEKLASLGSLVAGVAHEINNPLGIGVTDSSFLINKTRKIKDVYAEGKMTHEDFEDFLEDIIKISSRMNNNLLRAGSLVQSFKKLSVDQFVDEKSRFNVKAYFEELLLSLKPVFKGKEIDITLNGDDNIEINSNPGLFAQIITNFVINSVKHGFIDRNNGHIKLDIFKKDNRLNIIYYDNGSGIAEQHLSRIFEFFFTTGGGTGLGLNIVYNIVQKLKGNIKCESKEGEFTQFTIDIPIEI
jgi:signal transduction histidine kinase